MKAQHLPRYREIARLFFKYGRGDLLRHSDFDELEEETEPASNGEAGAEAPRSPVHRTPGEILLQEKIRAGLRPADALPSASGHAAPEGNGQRRGEELAADLEAMGPTFVKVGQFLSTRPDLLPVSYLEPLARLQDHVAPIPFGEIERIVTEELGVRISKAFSEFHDVPLAAASLGQVHRATLRDGRVVAVKVQRPEIRDRIEQDIEALEALAGFLDQHTEIGRRHGFKAMVAEFRKSLVRELDYRQEARNLGILAENLADLPEIVVPTPIEDYVTSKVLTMEFVSGRKVTALGPLARIEVDGAPLADALCKAYLQQTLVDGFFHADPHPGNVFVTADNRLALIDLGMVAQLSGAMQEDLLKLVLAVSEGRGDDCADVVLKIGTPVEEVDTRSIRRLVVEMVMQVHGLRLKEVPVGRMLFEVARVTGEHGLRMPRELTMLGKALLNVDQVAERLDPEFDPNESIRRHAAGIMRSRMMKALSPGKLFAGVLEAKQFAEKLPRRLNQLIDAVTENRVRVKVDAINEVLLMEGLQKIANRITLGLVISAMILGAALLMRIETSFRILGYPGLAMLLFLGAAVAAILLVMNIVLHDLKAAKHRLRSAERRNASPAEAL